MSVNQTKTSAMKMPSVMTLMDHIYVRVTMATLVMEDFVKVKTALYNP